jgi:hypothetical protein
MPKGKGKELIQQYLPLFIKKADFTFIQGDNQNYHKVAIFEI